MNKYTKPVDPEYEKSKGRVVLWLDPQDLVWLSHHCSCGPEATSEEKERCARIRFRTGAALHKAGYLAAPEMSPQEIEKALSEDGQLALERKILFDVCQKAAPGAKWETLRTMGNLKEAFTQAQLIDNYQTGLFARFPDGLGFVYWTSRDPHNLNSSIISMEYTT